MNNFPTKNFDEFSFDEWLNFVFNEKWIDAKDNFAEWFDLSDLNADIEVFAGNCIKLFENPKLLSDRYNSKQLESGFFYFILSPRVDLGWWIWSENSSVELRHRLILLMVNVFEQVFIKNPLEHSCFMWWDCLRDFSENPDKRANFWIFEALSKILEIDSIDCQLSALHGLGHLEYKGKKDLIENFLRKHPNFPDRNYALAAIEGKVL